MRFFFFLRHLHFFFYTLLKFLPVYFSLFTVNVLSDINSFLWRTVLIDHIKDITTNIYLGNLQKHARFPTHCIFGLHCCCFPSYMLLSDFILIFRSAHCSTWQLKFSIGRLCSKLEIKYMCYSISWFLPSFSWVDKLLRFSQLCLGFWQDM